MPSARVVITLVENAVETSGALSRRKRVLFSRHSLVPPITNRIVQKINWLFTGRKVAGAHSAQNHVKSGNMDLHRFAASVLRKSTDPKRIFTWD
jgi:hypothetical protein